MRVIGLTGSIACGKSTVSRFLSEHGCTIIDGDELSHRLTSAGGAAIPALRQAFGSSFILADGSLDRKKLGALVFSDESALRKLDALMAPFLREATQQEMLHAEESGADLCFLDMPLLFEKGYDSLCRSVWCVYLPLPLQLERLMARDHLTREEAMSRIRTVMSSDEKAARSNVVIDNSGTVEETLSQIPSLLQAERNAAKAVPRRRRSDRWQQADEGSPAEEMEMPTADRPVSSSPATPILPDNPGRSVSAPRIPDPDEGVDRPKAARRNPSKRKVAWKLPVWLQAVLISLAAVLAVAFTAQCLMNAYLARRQEEHLREQAAINDNYPIAYQDLIKQYAAEFNLNPAYVTAIIRNESSFRPKAESDAGARGLMQLMPDTAEWIAQKLKISGYAFERMNDPASNIRFGCWYLNYLARLFNGDVACVTCAYHAGQGTIVSWLSDSRYSDDGIHLVPERLPEGPTKQYEERVSRDYGIYQKKVYSVADPSDSGVSAVSLVRSGFLFAE